MTTHALMTSTRTDPLAWPGVNDSDRIYALLIHLTLLLYHLFIPIVPALVMWLARRDHSRFIDDHGRQALNFQFTLLLYVLVAWLLGLFTFGLVWFLGGVFVYGLGLVGLLLGARAAWKGRVFRYPMTIQFLRSAA